MFNYKDIGRRVLGFSLYVFKERTWRNDEREIEGRNERPGWILAIHRSSCIKYWVGTISPNHNNKVPRASRAPIICLPSAGLVLSKASVIL